jgi:hypothetical protein
MGFLNVFSKKPTKLLRLPSGSFTMDRHGKILVRTVPSGFPQDLVQQIGRLVLDSFREASAAQVPLTQIHVTYPNLKITARELRGGAMVFLTSKNLFSSENNK